MGGSFSITSDTSKSIVSSYVSAVNTVTNSVLTTSNLTASSITSASVRNGGVPECGQLSYIPTINGGVFFLQSNKLKVFQSTESQQTALANIKTNISSKLINSITQNTDTKAPAWFSAAFGIDIKDSNAVTTFVDNVVNAAFNDIKTTCDSIFAVGQNGVISNCGLINGGVLIDQTIAAIATQSCVSRQLTKTFIANQIGVDGISKADQITKNGDSPYAYLGYVAIAVLIVFAIMILISVFAHAKRHAKKPPQPKNLPRQGQPMTNMPPRAVPPRAVPGQPMPPRAVPPRAVPGQPMPPRAVPPRAMPGQPMPPRAMPGQPMPPRPPAVPPRAVPPRALPRLPSSTARNYAKLEPNAKQLKSISRYGRLAEQEALAVA
jgi:hypothetical protein